MTKDIIQIKNLNVRLGSFALKDINLNIKEGEYFVILGPSGNGKTVLMKSLVGFLKIDSGEIRIGGVRKDHLPPEQRDIGFVFQDHVLFPHMSVYDNVAFGLRMRKVRKSDIKEKVERIGEILKITHLLNRAITNLSGGERQRVALARSAVCNPSVIIMDEPFASLDRNLADELILEERVLHEQMRQTTIHITHNQEEAMTLADTICIMDNGIIRMVDTPENVFRKPNSVFVANFVCTENIYENAQAEHKEDESWLNYNGKKIYCSEEHLEGKVNFCVRPENILLKTINPDVELKRWDLETVRKNNFEGKIVGIYDCGANYRIVVDIGFLVVNLTLRTEFQGMRVGIGDRVRIIISEDTVHII